MDKKYPLLLFIILVAIALRLYHLEYLPIQIDEGWTLFYAQQPFYVTPFIDVHPPLYYWLVGIATSLFGTDLWALRSVSFFFGILSVPLAYFAGKELSGNDTAGLITAGLITLSTFHIHHSQDARSYTLIFCLFALMLIFYLRALKDNSSKNWLVVGISMAGLLWTYYFMIIPVATTVLFTIYLFYREPWRNIRSPYAGFMVLLASVLPLSLFIKNAWYIKTVLESPGVYELAGASVITTPFLRFMTNGLPQEYLIAGILAVLFVVGLMVIYKKNSFVAAYLSALYIVPFIGGIFLANLMMVNTRFYLFLLLPYAALIGYGWTSSTEPSEKDPKDVSWAWKGAPYMLCGAFVFVLANPLIPYYTSDPGWDYWTTVNETLSDITAPGMKSCSMGIWDGTHSTPTITITSRTRHGQDNSIRSRDCATVPRSIIPLPLFPTGIPPSSPSPGVLLPTSTLAGSTVPRSGSSEPTMSIVTSSWKRYSADVP